MSAIASGGGTLRFSQRWAKAHPTVFKKSPISKWTDGQSARMTARHLAQAAKAGDRFALTVMDHVTLHMAQALGVLVGSVGVEKIILVGGFALGVKRSFTT